MIRAKGGPPRDTREDNDATTEEANAAASRRRAGSDSLVQTYARTGGLLGIVSVAAGGFGEAYVPMMLIAANDAAATAGALVQDSWLFRVGFASYLVEALCDVGLALILYALLRPVHRDLALLATFFRLIGTAGYAVSQLFNFTAFRLVHHPTGLRSLSPEQLDSLGLLSIYTSQMGQTLFMMFYGMGFLLTGWLMLRARYLPTFLGILMVITGAGFALRTFLWVLAPSLASPFLLLPALVAGVALGFWLLIKGVDIEKWRRQLAAGQIGSL